MNREELLRALRRITSPDKHRCLGCGHEHNCSIHGCAIIRAAIEEIMRLAVENETLRRTGDSPERPMTPAERDAMLDWPPSPPIAPPPDDPLTLEELREMDGEPVWVDFSKCLEASGWMLVSVNRHCIYDGFLGDCDFENCGKTWMAYRRRPEEGKTDV